MPHHLQSLSRLVTFAVLVSIASAADWPMRGGSPGRNAVVPDHVGPSDWRLSDDPKEMRNVRWSAEVGSVSCGEPVVSQGLVWVGTNNGYRAEDAGVLACFDARDGKLLYRHVSPRLPEGRNVDWPMNSLASSPLVEGDRLWFCTNRCEVLCLDIAPLLARTGEPDVVWAVDMREKFGVHPRGVMIGTYVTHCSPVGYKDLIYVNTTHAANYEGNVVAPEAPSLLCLQKKDGAVRWQDNSPGENILDVQHGNPAVAEIDGTPQVIMGQGDGWLRGFHALTGEVLWKFDINDKQPRPKGRRYIVSTGGDREFGLSDLVPMPVVYDQKLYLTTGRYYEICTGHGRVACLDPTRRGDISAELDDGAGRGKPNPNSGLIWDYRGTKDEPMLRTMSSVVIHKGLLITSDMEERVHCLDAKTGAPQWTHLREDYVMCSPLIIGDRVYVNDSIGTTIFRLSLEKTIVSQPESYTIANEASPVFANGVLYILSRNRLFAIGP